jgi:predicted transcriptional regulator
MSNVITARVSDEILAMIDRLAKDNERTRAWIVARMVEDTARKQIELADFIQDGIDCIERGEYHTQEEMEAWFGTRKANRASRIAAE